MRSYEEKGKKEAGSRKDIISDKMVLSILENT
jgi:hypothetical protein